MCLRAHQLESVMVKHNSYIEGKTESHFAKATTVLETGCFSPLAAQAANHGPDRAPSLGHLLVGTYSSGHSSRHVGLASLPLPALKCL